MELFCSKYAPPLPAEVIPAEEKSLDRHTYKAIRAANTFVDLLSVPSPPTTHSPFVMCMGSMAIVTHLSACEYRLTGKEFQHARDRVRAFLGILQSFQGVWPQAEKWAREIKMMARVVFDGRDTSGQLELDPTLWVGASGSAEIPDEARDGIELAETSGTGENMITDPGLAAERLN